jgi:capsular polysaccharide biosynthesis protein
LTANAPTTSLSILSAARVWFRFLLLGAMVGAAVALAAWVLVPPDYAARVTLLVTPQSTTNTLDPAGLQATQALTPTFAELATTTPVLSRVIATTRVDLDPQRLALAVTTHVPVGTSLIDITVSNKDATMAAGLANAIASELVQYQAHSGNAETAALRVTLTVVDPAAPPSARSGPGIIASTALGAAIGLFIEFCLIYLLESMRQADRDKGSAVPPRPELGSSPRDRFFPPAGTPST